MKDSKRELRQDLKSIESDPIDAIDARMKSTYQMVISLVMILLFGVVPISHGAEPKVNCIQFVASEKNLSTDFRPEWLTTEMEAWGRQEQYGAAWGFLAKSESTEDQNKALYWFCRSATLGYPHAEWKFGSIYREGKLLPKDGEMAFYWLLRAAKHGNSRSQSIVSKMYSTGEGVEKNEAEAKKWSDIVKGKFLFVIEMSKILNESSKQQGINK